MIIPIIILSLTLSEAIQKVETGGERDPAHAIGDHGLARGWLQIHPAYYRDAQEYATRHGKPLPPYATTCASQTHSRACMAYYWARYGARTDAERALLHHYGPNWRRIGDPDGYLAKVQKAQRSR